MTPTSDLLNLHVSPGGNDRLPGTLATPSADGADGPLASLAGARDAIRRFKAQPGGFFRPVTVHVADGVYELEDTLRFAPEDSGTADAPIRYVAAEGTAPLFSGGRRITGWRESEHNGQRCWVAGLPEVAAGRWNFTRLYVNGAPRQRPRLPKAGFYRFTGLAGFENTSFNWCQGPDRANFAPGEIKAWRNWADVELVSYQLWFDTHHRFKAIDEDTNTVHFHARSLGSLRDERTEFARYFIENVGEALDTPGQWYLDRPTGTLTYLPLPDEKLETAVVVAPRLAELVRLQGDGERRVAHLRFENLAFAHQQWELPPDTPGYIQAAWGVPGAIILEGAERCVLFGCTVAHVNGYGIEVLAGSTGNVVAACAVHDAGAGGIKLGHESCQYQSVQGAIMPERPGLPPLATTVADCTIRDCGHTFPSAIGIWIGNSGWNHVVHNHVFNCTYTGISCGWTWGYAPTRTLANRIEDNHIHHINHREILSDNGGIYTLGRQPGTTVRGNVIHDISCYGYGAWGIYPDEGSSEIRYEHNLVCGTKKAAFSVHYGRDMLVQHNVLALSQDEHLSPGKREMHRTAVFRHNVLVPVNGRIRKGLPANWSAAHYTLEKNLFWPLDGTPLSFNDQTLADQQAQGQHLGSVVADPLFGDAAGGDFSLRTDSPVKRIGFKPHDWSKVGPRLTSARPLTFDEYERRFPLPSREVPVLSVKMELETAPDLIDQLGVASFSVTVSNIGRTAGKGVIRLKGGPKGAAGRPDPGRIDFDLVPGGERREQVTLKVRKGTPAFWLDSESVEGGTVPARALVLMTATWIVRRAVEVQSPREVAGALAKVPVRVLGNPGRTAAEMRLGATVENLLVHARLFSPALRPNLEEPWNGTAIELLAGQPSSDRRQVFLVPRADGRAADGLVLNAAGAGAEPAQDLQVEARPIEGGCELFASIPWSRLGFDSALSARSFEAIADVVNPATDVIEQVCAFDLPAAGWGKHEGRLEIERIQS